LFVGFAMTDREQSHCGRADGIAAGPSHAAAALPLCQGADPRAAPPTENNHWSCLGMLAGEPAVPHCLATVVAGSRRRLRFDRAAPQVRAKTPDLATQPP
jgi:hypothetical protein